MSPDREPDKQTYPAQEPQSHGLPTYAGCGGMAKMSGHEEPCARRAGHSGDCSTAVKPSPAQEPESVEVLVVARALALQYGRDIGGGIVKDDDFEESLNDMEREEWYASARSAIAALDAHRASTELAKAPTCERCQHVHLGEQVCGARITGYHCIGAQRAEEWESNCMCPGPPSEPEQPRYCGVHPGHVIDPLSSKCTWRGGSAPSEPGGEDMTSHALSYLANRDRIITSVEAAFPAPKLYDDLCAWITAQDTATLDSDVGLLMRRSAASLRARTIEASEAEAPTSTLQEQFDAWKSALPSTYAMLRDSAPSWVADFVKDAFMAGARVQVPQVSREQIAKALSEAIRTWIGPIAGEPLVNHQADAVLVLALPRSVQAQLTDEEREAFEWAIGKRAGPGDGAKARRVIEALLARAARGQDERN